MNRHSFCVAGSILLAAMLSCSSSKTLPPLDPDAVFRETEAALKQHYFAGPAAETPAMPRLYASAIAALQPDKETPPSRENLVALIQNQGEGAARLRTYRALGGFLSALPGANDFTRPEGLLLKQDPKRQAGVGLLLMQQGPGRIMVLDTLEASPASRAGIRPGSILKAIDGVEVKDMDLEEAAGRIRGEDASTVKLEFYGGAFETKRARFNFLHYTNATWDQTTGGQVEIITLRTTLKDTSELLKQFLLQMGKRSAVVLDLRKLQQGDYEECFRIADLFVSNKKLGSIITSKGPRDFSADPDVVFTGPVYVIVGSNSSSAADALASAIRSSLEVNILGIDRPGKAYPTLGVPIAGGIQLNVTHGVVTDSAGNPLPVTGVKADVQVNDYLPPEAPGAKPSDADPVHRQLRQILNLK